MKIIIVMLLSFAIEAHAQRVDLRGVDASNETNIQIRHGAMPNQTRRFEILDESVEIEGDPALLQNEGRENWKEACSDWKKEHTKNAEIVSVNCGIPSCQKEDFKTTCRSTASRKMRVLIQE